MSQIKRIVCYAVNGAGLGHVTRLSAVARWLKRYVTLLQGRPPEVLFLTSTEAPAVIAEAGFLCFKIPSKTQIRESGANPLSYRRLAKQFVWQVLGTFAPDLLVVDTFPSGNFDELLQILDAPFRKGFIFRHVKSEYANRPVFRSALRLYDTVIVPHQRTASEGLQVPAGLPLQFSGEVVGLDHGEARTRASVRAELGLAERERLIYISAGGGGDPHCESALHRLVDQLAGEPDLHLLVGAGPLYRGRRLSRPGLTWFTGARAATYFGACDAAISAGGYNTFHELIYFRVPTLFYHQEKVADDQARRIAAAAACGACETIDGLDDGEAIRGALRRLLAPERRSAIAEGCTTLLPANGASLCARQLLAPFYDEAQLSWAAQCVTPELAALAAEMTVESDVLGIWLPRLLPQAEFPAIAGHPQFESLLQLVSPAARAEIQTALESAEVARERGAILAAFQRYLAAVAAHPLPNGPLLGLIAIALKKHPLSQESHQSWSRWIGRLLEGLTALLRTVHAELTAEELLQLYRLFPRLSDAETPQAFAQFQGFVATRFDGGGDLRAVRRELQRIKFVNRRVRSADMVTPAGEVLP